MESQDGEHEIIVIFGEKGESGLIESSSGRHTMPD
jgi:hypothetical protein